MKRNSSREQPTPTLMAEYFDRAGLPIDGGRLDALWSYHQHLRRRNEALNLTRLYAFDSMVVKHYIDCAWVSTLIDLPSPLMDLGSGAGLPGIVLKIFRPEVEIVLAEGRENRIRFLQETIGLLGLKGISTYSGKIYPETRLETPIGGVITRAVESIEQTLERVSGCLSPGGVVIFMKGPGAAQEMKALALDEDAYRLAIDKPYALPILGDDRRLVAFTKQSETMPIKKPEKITSSSNVTFKKLISLQKSKGIKKADEFLLSGEKLVREVLRERPEAITGWIGTPQMDPPPETAQPIPWVTLSRELFREADLLGTHAPMVTMKLPEIDAFDPDAPWPEGCTLFVPFGDPENVGALIRSAAALGAARVVLTAEAANPFLPKALRSSAGTVWRVRLERGEALEWIHGAGKTPIFALDPDGAPLESIVPPDRYGLIVGSEGEGLPETLSSRVRKVSIPMANDVESLNASTSAALALWSWRKSNAG